MFLLKKGTKIKVYAPFFVVGYTPTQIALDDDTPMVYFDWAPWKDKVAKEDIFFDKEEVYDPIALANNRDDVDEWPWWIQQNVRDGWTVFGRTNAKGAFVWAMTKDMEYVD